MARRSETQTAAPPGFVRGRDIDLSSWHGEEIVQDTNNRVYCFVGYRRDDQPQGLPYYSPSVALRDRDGRTSYRFIELNRGVLSRSGFLRDDQYYRVIADRWLTLPSGSDSYFGVISRDDRNEDGSLKIGRAHV